MMVYASGISYLVINISDMAEVDYQIWLDILIVNDWGRIALYASEIPSFC